MECGSGDELDELRLSEPRFGEIIRIKRKPILSLNPLNHLIHPNLGSDKIKYDEM